MRKAYWTCIYLTFLLAAASVVCSILKLEIVTLILSLSMIGAVIVAGILYFGFVKFRCPKCGTVFKGGKWEMFFAFHMPTRRKMNCPVCQEKVWCHDFFIKKGIDK